ncbi:hypothetical protein PLICRDRAFT_171849 [Plicaturopsis crispa FD-325 SS-3]|nr:hypothetical protein PLICRDRAFT_171849 [Plicaturopsis crispa FD-325 SS-3]
MASNSNRSFWSESPVTVHDRQLLFANTNGSSNNPDYSRWSRRDDRQSHVSGRDGSPAPNDAYSGSYSPSQRTPRGGPLSTASSQSAAISSSSLNSASSSTSSLQSRTDHSRTPVNRSPPPQMPPRAMNRPPPQAFFDDPAFSPDPRENLHFTVLRSPPLSDHESLPLRVHATHPYNAATYDSGSAGSSSSSLSSASSQSHGPPPSFHSHGPSSSQIHLPPPSFHSHESDTPNSSPPSATSHSDPHKSSVLNDDLPSVSPGDLDPLSIRPAAPRHESTPELRPAQPLPPALPRSATTPVPLAKAAPKRSRRAAATQAARDLDRIDELDEASLGLNWHHEGPYDAIPAALSTKPPDAESQKAFEERVARKDKPQRKAVRQDVIPAIMSGASLNLKPGEILPRLPAYAAPPQLPSHLQQYANPDPRGRDQYRPPLQDTRGQGHHDSYNGATHPMYDQRAQPQPQWYPAHFPAEFAPRAPSAFPGPRHSEAEPRPRPSGHHVLTKRPSTQRTSPQQPLPLYDQRQPPFDPYAQYDQRRQPSQAHVEPTRLPPPGIQPPPPAAHQHDQAQPLPPPSGQPPRRAAPPPAPPRPPIPQSQPSTRHPTSQRPPPQRVPDQQTQARPASVLTPPDIQLPPSTQSVHSQKSSRPPASHVPKRLVMPTPLQNQDPAQNVPQPQYRVQFQPQAPPDQRHSPPSATPSRSHSHSHSFSHAPPPPPAAPKNNTKLGRRMTVDGHGQAQAQAIPMADGRAGKLVRRRTGFIPLFGKSEKVEVVHAPSKEPWVLKGDKQAAGELEKQTRRRLSKRRHGNDL